LILGKPSFRRCYRKTLSASALESIPVEYNQSCMIAALIVLPSIQGDMIPQKIDGILAPSEIKPLGTIYDAPLN